MSKHTAEDVADMMRQALQTKVGFSAWTVSTPHLEVFAEMVAQKAAEKERQEIIDAFKAHPIMQAKKGRPVIAHEFLKIVQRRGKK
jgi:hypothetical protein